MSDLGESTIIEVLSDLKVKVLRWAWVFVAGLTMATVTATTAWTKQTERVDSMQKERSELVKAVSELNLTLRELSTTLKDQDRRITRLEESEMKRNP